MPTPSDLSSLRIHMKYGPGSGMAPPYSITITHDAKVIYHKGWEDPSGETVAELTRTRLKNLVNAFLDADFFNLPEPDEAPTCDMPSTFLSFQLEGSARTIESNGTDEKVALVLDQLCARIENLAGIKPGYYRLGLPSE